MENENKEFESIKHLNEEGIEFWLARELQGVLQYNSWQNFDRVIDTAKVACKISQHVIGDHFNDAIKLVEHGSGAKRKIKDYKLTRYACR